MNKSFRAVTAFYKLLSGGKNKLVFLAFFAVLFSFDSGFSQTTPCLKLREKGVEFIETTGNLSETAKECANFRRRNLNVRERDGYDDISVSGRVKHENGVPMAGVTLTLLHINSGTQRTILTNEEGNYIFTGLEAAHSYKLIPSKENYTFTPAEVLMEYIFRDKISSFTAFGSPPPPPPVPANQPTLRWTSYYDNPLPQGSMSAPNSDLNAMLAQDSQGNVYVAGTSDVEYYDQNGNRDITLFKTDANGNRVWARTFGGSAQGKDGAVDIGIDGAGNIYVGGYLAVGSGFEANVHFVVLKYDSDGNLLWSREYEGVGGGNVPSSMKVDAEGNSYVTGYSWGTYANYATVKYDTNGNQMWAKRFVSGTGEMPTELELDSAGNVYVTGRGSHSVAGDAEDFLTIKYSPNGEQLWVNYYDTPAGNRNDNAHELEITADGDVIVMGISDDFQTLRTLMQKIDATTGETVWTKFFTLSTGGNIEDSPFAMKLDPNGNIILTGQLNTAGNDELDVYTAKFDGAGNQLWMKTFDGPSGDDYDGDPKLNVDANGNIYIGLTSFGFANFDVQVLKYDPEGQLIWKYGFDNPYKTYDKLINWFDDNSQPHILIDNDGNVIVACNSVIPGQKVNLTAFKLEQVAARRAVPFDFDGDKKADIAVFRPENGVWYILKSSDGSFTATNWGFGTDKLVPADYDGDGKFDAAVYREGNWYVLNSSNGSFYSNQFGITSDKPLPSDFDNDGKADLSVYREGIWYQLMTSNNLFKAVPFGANTDIPIPGDYDNNRRSDVAVYRGGNWYMSYQSGEMFNAFQFGASTDKAVPADYDGDGQTDIAVFRSGVWYITYSRTGEFVGMQWGLDTDIPVPADYDGDKKADIAVYRNGYWYIYRSSDNKLMAYQFGTSDDIPIVASFLQ